MADEKTAVLYSMLPLLQASELRSLRGRPAAIGAFNVNFYAQAEGILRGLYRAESPGIIQASKGANKFQGTPGVIRDIVISAMVNSKSYVPLSLHLDHGDEKSCRNCIENGFSSVMIDASNLLEEENIALTCTISSLAHEKGISVEGEYGVLSGVEEDISHQKGIYADPVFVPVFFDRSKCDCLAVSYGTSHGPNKGKTDALNVQIIRDSYAGLSAFHMNLDHFLVSHGSSTVPKDLVDKINRFGGNLKGTSGVPEYKILEAIVGGIRKINIDTDLRLGITAVLREYFYYNPQIEKESEALGLIKKVFTGELKLGNDDKPIEDPKELKDPRDYFWHLKKHNPDLLRIDYRESGDERYIEVMAAISDNVANHVEKLCRLFGSAGLAPYVDEKKTLENLAGSYTDR
ncbi:MAG: class II fructose-bisphosphate aldolase [Nanoarchaeota archaeon]|nr:class II fructose-bisphosphate aldolase [Nanoarchaeota archaeon]